MMPGTQDLRERLLAMLLLDQGHYVSGEAISRDLNMTRAAVWKHMQALQMLGWPIESAPRNGYRIPVHAKLPFSEAAISAAIAERKPEGGAPLPWRVSLIQQVDSTSTRLKEAAASGEPEGAVLFAEEQTGGRGRLGRQWASRPEQGIWMSVLLRPAMAPAEVQTLTLAASVAVVQALRAYLAEEEAALSEVDRVLLRQASGAIGIKWPNDILWQGRKLCGILTELAAEPERLSHVVIGIGLNVSHAREDFPPELQHAATSLVQILSDLGETFVPDRNRIAAHLLLALNEQYGLLSHGGLESILNRWRDASLTLGQEIQVMDSNGPWPATALEIGEDGRLLVRGPDGNTQWLLSGEISIRQKNQ